MKTTNTHGSVTKSMSNRPMRPLDAKESGQVSGGAKVTPPTSKLPSKPGQGG